MYPMCAIANLSNIDVFPLLPINLFLPTDNDCDSVVTLYNFVCDSV